jgi:hypothetical protein
LNQPASGLLAILGHQVCSSFRRAAIRDCAEYSTNWSSADSSRQIISASAIDDFPDCRGTLTNTSR